MKVSTKYLDRHSYKIIVVKSGKYQVYIRHKWSPFWKTMSNIVKKLPIMNEEIDTIEKRCLKSESIWSSRVLASDGYNTFEDAKYALNIFIHIISHIATRKDETDKGSLKMFAVIENI